MKKSIFAMLLASIFYTGLTHASGVKLLNTLSHDIAIDYAYCDQDYCVGGKTMTVKAASFEGVNNPSPGVFTFIKVNRAYTTDNSKKGNFRGCNMPFYTNGVLIFNDYNTNSIICSQGYGLS